MLPSPGSTTAPSSPPSSSAIAAAPAIKKAATGKAKAESAAVGRSKAAKSTTPAVEAAQKRAAVTPAPVKKVRKTTTKPAIPAKPKAKLVRDSFTMPQGDFDLVATLKERALGFKRPTKKSELLRAGLQVLAALPSDGLKSALERLVPLKTGRPKKSG